MGFTEAVKTDVIIIGAGPTGLSLACQLIRYGIDFIIIDKNAGVTPFSKALGVQARTLEIYEQLGLAQAATSQGAIAGKARFLEGGKVRGEIDIADIGQDLSPYPYLLILEQSKNEQLLYSYVESHQKDVLWNTELESFSQNDEGVAAQIKTADGASQSIEAKYLVGCDGPKSPVRHALGLPFEGSTFARIYYVADVQIDWKLSHDALHISLGHDSFVLFFPMDGDKRYRIVGNLPEDVDQAEGELLYEEIEAKIKSEAKLDLDISNVAWFSTYKIHTRHASAFSGGRCFLAGDAAHVHSPVGAQGMNTGIQDAYDLAWKLAFVLKGYAAPPILETYNEERLKNAKRLLQTTDRLFELVSGTNPVTSFIRTTVFPPLANVLFSLEAVQNAVFPVISQIGINYRDCSLSKCSDDTSLKVKAGDRMPYFLVDGKSLYEQLKEPKFHLLSFLTTPGDSESARDEIASQYAYLLDYHIIELTPEIAELFGTDEAFHVLVRPDNYIGFIFRGEPLEGATNYLSEITGHLQP